MIDLDRWREIKEIVQAALDLSPEERPQYIATACKGDEALQHEVEALLAVSATRADAFDELRVVPPAFHQIRLKEGDEVGTYRILRVLGQGGMGLVYLAHDTVNDRDVALKVLPPGSYHPSRDREEHRILARLTHPNIAVLYTSGSTDDGLPYFAMEYVEGVPVTTYCETHQLGTKERLLLFVKICQAVAHAHWSGVIHRDLKPENILVTPEGEPKLLDFGIARLTAHSEVERLMGAGRALTLPFASPEQLNNEPESVATDVYSLGVLLCLLLTEQLPYPAKSDDDLYWAIRNLEPTPPSQLVKKAAPSPGTAKSEDYPSIGTNLSRQLRGDVDAIVLQALAKEPDARYASVRDLSDDVQNYLNHRPVRSRNGSLFYRSWKRVERQPIVAGLVALLIVFLLGAAILFIYQYGETRAARDRAEAQALRAEQVSEFLVGLFKLPDPMRRPGSSVTARELLDKAANDIPSNLHDQPETQVHLLNTLGEVYNNLGLTAEAEKRHAQALHIAESRLGQNSLAVADTLVSLGVVRATQGKYKGMERLNRRSLSIRQRGLPANHPDIAETLFNLGVALAGQNKGDEAASLYHQALSVLRANGKPESREDIALCLNALGVTYSDQGQIAKAKPLLREALEIQESIFGKMHPEVATTLNNLAITFERNREFAEAEALQRRALDISRKHLGPNHPLTVVPLANLAFLFHTSGNLEKALVTFREALQISRVAYGNNHSTTLWIMVHIARTLMEMERFQESERTLAEAYELARKADPRDESLIGNIPKTQAQVLAGMKRYSEAEVRVREAIAILSRSMGADHYVVTMTKAELGSYLARQGKFIEAEPMLLRYLEVAIERDKEEALGRLARLYELWGKSDMAAKYEALRAKQAARPEK